MTRSQGMPARSVVAPHGGARRGVEEAQHQFVVFEQERAEVGDGASRARWWPPRVPRAPRPARVGARSPRASSTSPRRSSDPECSCGVTLASDLSTRPQRWRGARDRERVAGRRWRAMDFRILGPLEVRAHGRRLALGGPKQRALLAILLLQADRVVSRDRLIEELWADDPPAAARHALEVNVSRLRKALAANGAGDSALVTRAPGYVLHVAPGELDLWRFERLVEDGRRALERGRPRRRGEGAAGGRGPVARAAAGGSGVRAVRARGRRAARGASPRGGRGSGRRRARARPSPRLVAELEALTAEHPLRERLRAQLMLALYRCGRQADALDDLPRGRGRRSSSRSASSPGPSCARCTRRSCGQDPALDAARAARAAARSSRRSRRWSAATPSWSACATRGSGRAAIAAASRS